MKKLIWILVFLLILIGCGSGGGSGVITHDPNAIFTLKPDPMFDSNFSVELSVTINEYDQIYSGFCSIETWEPYLENKYRINTTVSSEHKEFTTYILSFDSNRNMREFSDGKGHDYCCPLPSGEITEQAKIGYKINVSWWPEQSYAPSCNMIIELKPSNYQGCADFVFIRKGHSEVIHTINQNGEIKHFSLQIYDGSLFVISD